MVDLALLAVQAGSCPAGDVVGEPVPDKSRRHKTSRGEPPRVGNVVQVKNNVSSEFSWDNRAENSSSNIANQALSACFSKLNFEGCTAEQMLSFTQRFCSAAMASKSTVSAAVSNNIFQTVH